MNVEIAVLNNLHTKEFAVLNNLHMNEGIAVLNTGCNHQHQDKD